MMRYLYLNKEFHVTLAVSSSSDVYCFFLCVCVFVCAYPQGCFLSSFNDPPVFSLQQEVIFGVLWDPSLVTTLGQSLGAEKVVEAACATSVSFAGWDWNLVVSCSSAGGVHLF